MKKIVASGYFDPIHIGHLEYLKLAKEFADKKSGKLIVIVNNDEQATLKKGKPFMPLTERVEIVKALKYVDEVFISIDKDRTVCKSIEAVKPDFFVKGGDRTTGEIPETPVCNKLGVPIVDGLGEKIQSSSNLVKNSQ